MKKLYSTPEVELIRLMAKDIMTGSRDPDPSEDDKDWGTDVTE